MRDIKVLDTNILLLDANNLLLIGNTGSIVALPETVLDELDSKKSLMNELGYQARSFGRLLTKATVVTTSKSTDDTRTITELVLDGVTIWVVALSKYEASDGNSYSNDRKILEVCESLGKDYPVKFISMDVMARIRAISLGISTEPMNQISEDKPLEFTKHIEVPYEEFHTIHNKKILEVYPSHSSYTFNYMVSTDKDISTQVKLCSIENGIIKVIGAETEKELRRQEINPCNSGQIFLSKAIQDPLVDIVICEALSGSGKTSISISNAIRLVNQGKYSSIVYIRNSINDVDDIEEVGFLSGNAEKFAVYLHPLEDTLEFICREKLKESKLKGLAFEEKLQEGITKLKTDCNIEGITALGLRGRTFNNAIIIWDEAQNASNKAAQKLLTRVGKNCKVIVIGSNRQIDNPFLTKHTNALSVLLNASGVEQELVKIHVVDLHKVVRSTTADWAERLFSADLKL